MNTQVLEKLGLSKREQSVYLALISLGSTTTGPLAKESKVPNSKIYETLDKLMGKGLVSYVLRSKVKFFQATDADNLLQLFEEKQTEVQKLVNEIKLIGKKEQTQESYIYEGLSGVKAAFTSAVESLTKGDEFCVFSLGEELAQDDMRIFWASHFRMRKKKGVKTRAMPHSSLRKIFKKYYGQYDIEMRFSKNKMPAGTFLYKDHVISLVWSKNPVAFVIKSNVVYERYLQFFETIWNAAEK